jgi:hypothetical protein
MPDQRRHRGPHPEDARLFAPDQVAALRAAARDLSWLLAREYAIPSALKLVGDRHGLEARQRLAVARCACPPKLKRQRLRRRRQPQQLAGQPLWIDGFNVLTSVEAALSQGVLIRGLDGCLRDMASMHGSYRQVEETQSAIQLLGRILAQSQIRPCRWFLDQPVSNSGRLRAMLLDAAARQGWEWEVELVPNPDPILAAAECCVATSDSQILNQVRCWIGLVDLVIRQEITQAWIVDLSATGS